MSLCCLPQPWPLEIERQPNLDQHRSKVVVNLNQAGAQSLPQLVHRLWVYHNHTAYEGRIVPYEIHAQRLVQSTDTFYLPGLPEGNGAFNRAVLEAVFYDQRTADWQWFVSLEGGHTNRCERQH